MNYIPLTAPVVMCLAEQNGMGLRIRLVDTTAHRSSQFCQTCPAQTPCNAYHATQPKEAS